MITTSLSPRRIQFFLFIGIALIALYFTVRLGGALYTYFPLNGLAEAKVNQWEVSESGSKYLLKALYSFEVQGKSWKGAFAFKRPYYNEALAVADLKDRSKKAVTVWYNSKNPQISALEREFPTALLIRVLICYGVVLYFFFLNKKIQSVDF